MGPGNPVHTIWRRDAVEFYGWQEKYGWTDEDLKEMWASTDLQVWEDGFQADDAFRKDVMGDEPHWYLAPLLTIPEFQGRGVGSLLLKWAFEKADKTDPATPLYLESSAAGMPVYKHHGFVRFGETANMVRRGPMVVEKFEKKGESNDKNAEDN